jgi:WD40 repeat protein
VNYGGIQSLAYPDDGRTLALATALGGAVLWDVAANQERAAFRQENSQPFAAFSRREGGNCCLALAISPDSATLASADFHKVHLWDVLGGSRRATLAGHPDAVRSLAFSPDGALLLSGGWGGNMRLWDVASARPLAAFDWDVGRVHHVAFSPDGMTAAVAGHTGTVVVWDVDPDASPPG